MNTNSAVAVVETICPVSRTPVMGQETAIRVGATTGNGHKSANMVQDTTDKIFTELAEFAALTGVMEQVLTWLFTIFRSPQAQVNVSATAGLVEEGLGGE